MTSRVYIILSIILSIIIGISQCQNVDPFPVPLTKGGRNAVHGWLILPLDQNLPNPQNPSQPIQAYFSHHTPEFATDSPHNFQIILLGTITPLSSGDNITYPVIMNYPPENEFVVDEFTFTPPPPFSLNDLLSGDITQLLGVVFNGSFDTPYERIAVSVGYLNILELTTTVYLNDSVEIQSYDSQRYLSYPRLGLGAPIPSGGIHNFYWAHEIHAVPDFDQVVHVSINLDACLCGDDSCSGNDEFYQQVFKGGVEWIIPDLPNDIDNRLLPETTPIVTATVSNGLAICKVQVLESIHCVSGPDFYQIC